MKMNLPNKLTIARIILAPFSMIFILYAVPNETWARIFAASLFLLTAVTDLIDGKLARKFGWITNFGKFMDPLADKFMVFGALIAMCTSSMYEKFHAVLIWVTVIVIFRELAVTSMRLLVVSADGTVVAANWLGKVKTVSQVVCIATLMLEPLVIPQSFAFYDACLLSWITLAFMTLMTVWSGLNYMKAYAAYIDTTH